MAYDYGQAGRIGIGTPQANPTVETEFSMLIPPRASVSVTRLTSQAHRPLDRLTDYLTGLEQSLLAFDSLKLDAFGFGCTASSYLVSRDVEEQIFSDAAARFGYPIFGAANAIAWALDKLGAKRIAILSPYPPELAEPAHQYWKARGLILAETGQAGTLGQNADTRGIYELGSSDALAALAQIDLSGLDAVLFSGTGMPSLPAIANAPSGVPLLSSNLCLAAQICAHLGLGDLLDPQSPESRNWQEKCRVATAAVTERIE